MFFYFFEIIKPFLILKLNIKHLKNVPKINNIIVSIFIKNFSIDETDSIIKSFFFLEYFGKILPKLVYFTQYEKKKRFNNVKCSIILFNYNIYFFLNWFINNIIKYLKKKNIYILNKNISKENIFVFKIIDFSVFTFLPYVFYNWNVTLLFSIKFSNINKLSYKNLLNSFNFPF